MVMLAMSEFPWLSLLILLPPLAAILIWALPSSGNAREMALLATLVELLVSIGVLVGFNPEQSGFQMVERYDWIPSLNIQYLIGVDGLSVMFLPLTSLLFLGVIVVSWNSIRTLPRLYFSLLLIMLSVTQGIFVALDTMIFFLFWELTLVPLYFLVSLWGIGPNRRFAAVKYTLFMLVGGVPLLFGFILLAINHAQVVGSALPAGLAFDLPNLMQTPVALELQVLVFFLLLIGFAFKTPVVPFHTWLPIAAQEGSVATVALLTGLKLGAYGVIRFTIPLAPEAAAQYHWMLAGLGVIGILYGAVLALAQTNIRRMLAYSSISHVGMVLLGVSALTIQGLQGAVFQLLNFTLVAGGTFLLTSMLHHRIGSTDLINLGGVAKRMPLLATLFFVLGLASMGIPGTSGFPAEFLIIIAALETHTGAGLAALAGLVLGAAYFMRAYRRAFLGPISNTVIQQSVDLKGRELVYLVPVVLLIIWAGCMPQVVLALMDNAALEWIARFTAQ